MCIYEVVEKGQSDLNDDLNDYEYNLTLIKYILYISDKKCWSSKEYHKLKLC